MLYIALGDGGSGGDRWARPEPSHPSRQILRIDGIAPFRSRFPRTIRSWATRPRFPPSGLRPANPSAFGLTARRAPLHRRRGPERLRRDVGLASRRGGENSVEHHGGSRCFRPSSAAPPPAHAPVVEYGRGDGCSITAAWSTAAAGCRGITALLLRRLLHGMSARSDWGRTGARPARLDGALGRGIGASAPSASMPMARSTSSTTTASLRHDRELIMVARAPRRALRRRCLTAVGFPQRRGVRRARTPACLRTPRQRRAELVDCEVRSQPGV